MAEIKELLEALIEQGKVTNAKLEGIELRLSSLEGAVKGVADKMDHLDDDVDYITAKVVVHDREIFKLKRKLSD